VLRTVGAVTEVAFVYGGGSGPIKDAVYPALLSKVNEMNTISAFPILYLDSSYLRHLNREGLFIAVKTVEKRARKSARTQDAA
jgi:plasmid segregation protein ParM